jgi:hypothetical protein
VFSAEDSRREPLKLAQLDPDLPRIYRDRRQLATGWRRVSRAADPKRAAVTGTRAGPSRPRACGVQPPRRR